MKTVVITHVYKIAEPFLLDMFNSVNRQSDKDFDFVVFNYGISQPLSQFGFFGKEVENKWGLGVPDARDWAMKYALDNNYDLAIFIDADDTMAEDRVEVTKKTFEKVKGQYGFYYTSLNFMHLPESDFFSGALPFEITSYNDVENSNCVGLSNFAIDVKKCSNVISKLNVPSYVLAYDWYFVSLLLMNGVSGMQVPTKTFYRIHSQNIAGDTNKISLDIIKRTVSVKQAHFQALLEFLNINCNNVDYDTLEKTSESAKKYSDLKIVVARINDVSELNVITHVNKSNSSHWWSII